MPPIRTGQFGALLAPDRYRIYVQTGRERPLEFPFIMNVLDLPWQGFTNQQVSGLGTVPTKPEGTAFTYDAPILGGTKTHSAIEYGLGFEITYEMWNRELYGIMDMMTRELRRSIDYRLEVGAHNALTNAFVTTNFTTFDGAALISTAHTTLDGRTGVANRPAVEIQAGLTAFQNMVVHYHRMTNERNIPELRGPRNLIINPEFLFTVRETLGSTHKPFSANNEINSIVQEELTFMVDHYIGANPNAWYALAAKGDHDLNFYVETRPIFDYFDDPRTMNAVFTVYSSFEPSQADDWRGIYGSTG